MPFHPNAQSLGSPTPVPPGHDPFDLFTLSAPVGPGAANQHRDVAKLEALLAGGGVLDLAPTDGPTGAFDDRLVRALRGAQKVLSQTIDGLVNAGGPTIQALMGAPGPARLARQAGAVRTALPHIPAAIADGLRGLADDAVAGRGPDTLAGLLAGVWGTSGRIGAIELLGLVGERHRPAAARLRTTAAPLIAAAERPLLFAGDFVRALSREEAAQAAAKSGGAVTTSAGTGTIGSAGPSPPAPPPALPVQLPAPRPVPRYRQQVFTKRVNRTAWPDFLNAVQGTPGLSRAEQHTFTEIFAAEGGLDPDGTTVAGIEQPTLNRLIALGHVRAIKKGTPPTALSMAERVRVYKAYFDDALFRAGGTAALRRIGNAEATAAFADTVFRHGAPEGARLIQSAINDVGPQRVPVDGRIGRNTVKAFADLAADPRTRRALLGLLADHRARQFANHPNRKGELARIDYFRYRASP